MKLFAKASRTKLMPESSLDQITRDIQRSLNSMGAAFATREVATAALSMESIDPGIAQELDSSMSGLSAALESIAMSHGIAGQLSQAQKDAAVAAGIIATDPRAALAAPIKHNVTAMEGVAFIGKPLGAGDYFEERMRPALEAYDEKENKNAVVYSVAYNMQAARQDEFGEAFFPTVVITPDQVGFAINIRIISVYNEVRRQITGQLDNFGKRNIIHAVIDPTILRNDQTKIVPVFRDESKSVFVDPALVAPYDVDLFGEVVTTAPLAMGKSLSLLGVSQTAALLETGLLDSSDAIDPSIVLDALYMRVKGAAADGSEDEVVKFVTNKLPTSVFTYAVQGNYRMMNLTFTNDSMLVSKNTKQVDGSASVLLNDIVAGEYNVRLGVKVSGGVNLELADTNLFASEIVVKRVTTKDGVQLAETDVTYQSIAALFNGASMIGYDLQAWRTNTNRRQRGQLLDTTFYTQVYSVPLRSPITIPRPLTVGDQNDSSDLAALITATHIRASNAAVDELLRVSDVLNDYTTTVDAIGDTPEILGVARSLIKPVYHYQAIDVATIIDSLKSHERAEDIQAVLVNLLRDVAYRMYRDSGYKAAADALAGGVSAAPTVIIGTDPVIARYLTVTGDLRTLGNQFNVKIVSTLNQRMAGKIAMTFGCYGDGADGVPNPMHFGNMAWKPELTVVLPLHRNGQTSKELTVQPSFLHINHLPILAMFDISGIPDVVNAKVPVKLAP